MPKKEKAEKVERDMNRRFLERKFREAKAKGEVLQPDDAMRELTKMLEKINETHDLAGELEGKQVGSIAYRRDLHIHAVNLFYRINFPRKGAPRLSDEYLRKLLEMYEKKGMSYKDIGLAEEPDLKTSDDIDKVEQKYRKRIQEARKRRGNP